MPPRLRIISGGQTGADRAALDFALEQGIPHGGWCPKGRLAEDGPISRRYRLRQTPGAEYLQRTEWNVRDADATVIISVARELSGGSLATQQFARLHHKPCLHLVGQRPMAANARRLQQFVRRHRVKVLNVAGPRASHEPGAALLVKQILTAAFARGSKTTKAKT
ncbi:MAG: putative molybdenum carrier protein [Verrucomicrobiota bacterium]